MQYPTERELLERIKEGHENAFVSLYLNYYPLMLKIAYNKFLDKQEAEDIVQEIFMSLWQRRETLSLEIPIKYYLLRAVHLQYAQYCRHSIVSKKYLKYLQVFGENFSMINILENKELRNEIHSAISDISAPACRKIFEMSYIEQYNCKEIAYLMKIKQQVVRNQTSRALKVLRNKLKNVI